MKPEAERVLLSTKMGAARQQIDEHLYRARNVVAAAIIAAETTRTTETDTEVNLPYLLETAITLIDEALEVIDGDYVPAKVTADD
jgi:hypothetical protein